MHVRSNDEWSILFIFFYLFQAVVGLLNILSFFSVRGLSFNENVFISMNRSKLISFQRTNTGRTGHWMSDPIWSWFLIPFFFFSSHDLSQTTNKALWMSIVMIELYFVRQKRKNQLNSMFRRACISSILIESSKVNKVNKKKFLIRHRRSTSTTHKESERNKTPSHIRIIIISVWLCVRAIESMCLFWWVCDVDTWPINNRGLDDPQTKWTQEIKYIGPNLICIWQLDSR